MKITRVVGVGTAVCSFVVISIGVIALGPFEGPEPALPFAESSAPVPVDQCRQGVRQDVSGDVDPLELVLDAGEAAQARAGHCETEPVRRICRALWLAQQLDPVLVALRGDDAQRRRAEDLLDWALADATAVAGPDLADALAALIVDPTDVDALKARAAPGVIVPLTQAEQAC